MRWCSGTGGLQADIYFSRNDSSGLSEFQISSAVGDSIFDFLSDCEFSTAGGDVC